MYTANYVPDELECNFEDIEDLYKAYIDDVKFPTSSQKLLIQLSNI